MDKSCRSPLFAFLSLYRASSSLSISDELHRDDLFDDFEEPDDVLDDVLQPELELLDDFDEPEDHPELELVELELVDDRFEEPDELDHFIDPDESPDELVEELLEL